MMESVGMMKFPIYGKIKNVPNISKPPTSYIRGFHHDSTMIPMVSNDSG